MDGEDSKKRSVVASTYIQALSSNDANNQKTQEAVDG